MKFEKKIRRTYNDDDDDADVDNKKRNREKEVVATG